MPGRPSRHVLRRLRYSHDDRNNSQDISSPSRAISIMINWSSPSQHWTHSFILLTFCSRILRSHRKVTKGNRSAHLLLFGPNMVVSVWDEEGNIDPSSGERRDLFTVGSPDVWGAAGSALTVSRSGNLR